MFLRPKPSKNSNDIKSNFAIRREHMKLNTKLTKKRQSPSNKGGEKKKLEIAGKRKFLSPLVCKWCSSRNIHTCVMFEVMLLYLRYVSGILCILPIKQLAVLTWLVGCACVWLMSLAVDVGSPSPPKTLTIL